MNHGRLDRPVRPGDQPRLMSRRADGEVARVCRQSVTGCLEHRLLADPGASAARQLPVEGRPRQPVLLGRGERDVDEAGKPCARLLLDVDTDRPDVGDGDDDPLTGVRNADVQGGPPGRRIDDRPAVRALA